MGNKHCFYIPPRDKFPDSCFYESSPEKMSLIFLFWQAFPELDGIKYGVKYRSVKGAILAYR
jgi:hypothetical protein